MASKKKSSSQKKANSNKVRLRNLPKPQGSVRPEQARDVKGGQIMIADMPRMPQQ